MSLKNFFKLTVSAIINKSTDTAGFKLYYKIWIIDIVSKRHWLAKNTLAIINWNWHCFKIKVLKQKLNFVQARYNVIRVIIVKR